MEKRPVDVAVISDLHLGTYGCRAREIVTYLKSICPQILVLNGDIIDAWQFSKHYFPQAHMAVIQEIFQMLSNGTRVIYITGNHDEVLRRCTDVQLGNLQLTDKLVIEIDHKMTWIFHGDVFDNTTKGSAKFWAKLGSNGYAILLGFNRVINRCMKLLGREPLSFSKKVMEQVNKSIVKINDFETLVAELAIEKKYDYVICGHIHQPQKRTITTEKGSVVYLNAGDWIEHLTALEYYHNDWHIYTYAAAGMKTLTIKENKPQTDVITSEIALYLHSLGA
ncbi:MAG TPA: UDP-2,3-diacylglucosamine diphosphatase [Chitinophagaceae bacterium]|jgi:UDP-2,3-diacylglucosamine pyrophosphatase LpxH|nr:UDP-2,3-diacylglucosamine diphosphatase [Chitinophagaceae bacterium]